MKASFVIATYNRADDLERCLDSILKQQNCDIEIIVIDDASKDQTCCMVREKYGDKIQLISRTSNSGSIKNRNHGARLACGEVLFVIDDDTELPGVYTASEIVREFDNPVVGAVAIPYLQDGKLHHSEPDSSGERFVLASYVGCACAVRRSTFLELGGYEEFFHHQVEEDDFCIRMLNADRICMIGRVSEPMAHYESPERNFFNWDYYGRRNSLLYIWKNCPLVYLIPNLILTTVRGVSHAFRIKRVSGNIKGLVSGYLSIVQSVAGKGCKRNPVRKEVYDLALRLRKAPLRIQELDQIL